MLLYELATAQTPFARKNTVLTIDAILNEQPPAAGILNPAVPPGLDRVIGKALQKDRESRYQNAADLALDLMRVKEGKAVIAATAPGPRRLWLATALGALVLAVIAFFYLHRSPVLTAKDTIVLADFKNTTGDAVFDGTLRQGLAIQLEQSLFLSLISGQRMRQTLRLMGQPADAPITAELAREICERTGSAAVLEGTIAPLGSQFVLGLSARNCRTGEILDEEQVQAASKEGILNSLTEIAGKFRRRIGESAGAIATHATPLAEATTPSLEALKAFSLAGTLKSGSSENSAVPQLKRAIAIDPKFAMAYAALGLVYSIMGESDLSIESTRKAYELRERTSEPEKFFITFSYDRHVTGNLKKAQATAELWGQTYPRVPDPHSLLAGFVTQGTGEYERGANEAQLAIELDPDHAPGYENLAFCQLFRERYTEAESTLDRAAARTLDNLNFFVSSLLPRFPKERPRRNGSRNRSGEIETRR